MTGGSPNWKHRSPRWYDGAMERETVSRVAANLRMRMCRPSLGFARSSFSFSRAVLAGLAATALADLRAADWSDDPAGIEFFERRIRPAFAEHCVKCHGAEKQQGELRLDRPRFIRRGGELGAEVAPGRPDESRLIHAVRYEDPDLQMPPDGKLPPAVVADFEEWVRRGAPAPLDDGAAESTPESRFDLKQRGEHWCYQSVQRRATPEISQDAWSRSPVDRFLLASMRELELSPAPPAEPRALARRAAFGLVGLPPSPELVARLAEDGPPDAWERWLDRLLASPRYGERWGRHWLDVVRFSESLGHEFDYEIPNAWRYRDYVIRAFNADLPYDQFVREHVAGDLFERTHPVDGTLESAIGPAFFWFGDATHSPVDVRQAECDRIDNQIDVLTKAFLAQSVACARCHDHKFDAVSAKDYYALAGFLKSSRYEQAPLDSPEARRRRIDRFRLFAEATPESGVRREELAAAWGRRASRIAEEMLASLDDAAPLGAAWREALRADPPGDASHPMYVWAALAAPAPGDEKAAFRRRADRLAARLRQARDAALAARASCLALKAAGSPPIGWRFSGDAFGGEDGCGAATLDWGDDAARPIVGFVPRSTVSSRRLSKRFEGAARTETFTIEKRYVHVRAAGRASRINVIVDGFQLIRDPIYGPLAFAPDSEAPSWRTVDVRKWMGRSAYLEFLDVRTPNLTQSDDGRDRPDAYFLVEEVLLSDSPSPPPPLPSAAAIALLGGRDPDDDPPDSLEALADRCQRLTQRLLKAWAESPPRGDGACGDDLQVLDWMMRFRLLDLGDDDASIAVKAKVDASWRERSALEACIDTPPRAPSMCDGTGTDEFLLVRGNHRTPAEPVERRFLEVFDGPRATPLASGSGREALSERIASPSNSLTARVMVNRIWKHLFGEGIVRSVDDFGRMGERPTHPELLDWLAEEFVSSGWSVKHVQRLLAGSAAYRTSSAPTPTSRDVDARNERLSRFPSRRLEAEAVRDSLLALSGRLDSAMEGPGEPPHLTEFSPAIGRPDRSGPRDGAGRRSVYLTVRRNFLSPFLLAFDYPLPQTTVGRRNSSNVPAQALALWNDPFVRDQARIWAERLLSEGPPGDRERIDWLFWSAFGRKADDAEAEESLALVRTGREADRRDGWSELCHALMNAKELIYLD